MRLVMMLVLGCALSAIRAEETVQFGLTYEARVLDVPADAQHLRMWLPVPGDTAEQTITELLVESTHGAGAIAELSGGSGRCWSVATPGEAVHVSISVLVTRTATSGGERASAEALTDALLPDRLIPLDGALAAQAEQLSVPAEPTAAARALFDHTRAHLRVATATDVDYGRGDAEWVVDSRFGNAADWHSYFVGLARCRRLPARFESGFLVPDEKAGAEVRIERPHYWAWFYAGGARGWSPVDVYAAAQQPALADYYCGNLDPWRVTLNQGRDLELSPAAALGPRNLFVRPYVEVDGAEHPVVAFAVARTVAE